MSSFKNKLARLPALKAAAAAPPPPSLDELRARMGALTGGPAAAAPSRLDFEHQSTPLGPLHSKRLLSADAERVGHASLASAARASSTMLARLALDRSLEPCAPAGALYLDTETTGLSGGTGTIPFLIGLGWRDEGSGGWVVEQLLLRGLGEEAPMLARLAERIARATMIVTYNGKSFDVPLLRARFVMNRLEVPVLPPHLDLVHVARRVHRARLASCTLISVEENVLGRSRVDDLPGSEIPAVYAHFLRSGDDRGIADVARHNADDVLAMVALLGLYGEPAPSLIADDLASVARTLSRAGAIDDAAALAHRAVEAGGGTWARRVRGDLAKARGELALALLDYAAVDDPAARLELAKLYEHRVRDPALALEAAERGTNETEEAGARRRARLLRKLERS